MHCDVTDRSQWNVRVFLCYPTRPTVFVFQFTLSRPTATLPLCAGYEALRHYALSHLRASERAFPLAPIPRVLYFNRSLPSTAEFRVSRSRRKNYSMAYRLVRGFNRSLDIRIQQERKWEIAWLYTASSFSSDRFFFQNHVRKLNDRQSYDRQGFRAFLFLINYLSFIKRININFSVRLIFKFDRILTKKSFLMKVLACRCDGKATLRIVDETFEAVAPSRDRSLCHPHSP